MRILVMTDSPNVPTGMGRVGGEIAMALSNSGHEIVYIAWNKENTLNKTFPFDIIPVENWNAASDVFDQVIYDRRPDVVLTIGDPWMFSFMANPKKCKSRRFFQWIGYTAVDGECLGGGLPNFWGKIISQMDRVIAYTKYGHDALLKTFPEIENRLDTISHGVDTKTFFPLSEEERQRARQHFHLEGKFLFLVVARNTGRKNWPELFKAWKIIQDKECIPDGMLWPHTYFHDSAGHNIENLLHSFKLQEKKTIMYFDEVAQGTGNLNMPPEKDLNTLYNIADCLVSLGGEGFGLPVLEAMATKTPCILLKHSATGDLGANGRGLFIEPSFSVTGIYLTERPFPNPEDIVNAMWGIKNDKETREGIVNKAYEFSQSHTWEAVGKQWVDYFEQFNHPTKYPMILEEVQI